MTLPANIAKGISRPLDAMLNGPMKESNEGVVHFEHIDTVTFETFTQYAYFAAMRPRKAAGPCTLEGTATSTAESVKCFCGKNLDAGLKCPKPNCSRSKCLLAVIERRFCSERQSSPGMTASEIENFVGLFDEDGRDKSVTDAKTFNFAHMYMIEDLKAICLHRIHKRLLNRDIRTPNMDFFEYVFPCSGTEMSYIDTREMSGLQKLVAAYLAYQPNWITGDTVVREHLFTHNRVGTAISEVLADLLLKQSEAKTDATRSKPQTNSGTLEAHDLLL